MRAVPILDRILVKQEAREEKISKKVDLVASEAFAKRPNSGVVVAIGPGLPDKPMQVKVGDHIKFGGQAGTQITLSAEECGEEKDTEYLMMLQDHVIAIIKPALPDASDLNGI